MKKRALFLCAVLMLCITGCGNSGAQDNNPDYQSEESEVNTTEAQSEVPSEPETSAEESAEESALVVETSEVGQNKHESANDIDVNYKQLHDLIEKEETEEPMDFTRTALLEQISQNAIFWELEYVTQEKFNDYDVFIYAQYYPENSTRKEKISSLLLFYEKDNSVKNVVYYYRHCFWEGSKNAPYDIGGLIAVITSNIFYNMYGSKDQLAATNYMEMVYNQLEDKTRLFSHNETRLAYDNTYQYTYQVTSTVLESDDACLIVQKKK